MNTQLFDSLNALVKNFLTSNDLESEIPAWENADIQQQLEAILSKTKKQRKSRKTKDPSKPKRARTAYIFFCMEQRSLLKEEFPELDSKSITRKLGERWNEIKNDEDEKEKYQVLADQDKERYKSETSSGSEEEKEEPKEDKKTVVKKSKKKAIKKRKVPGFGAFASEMREQVKEENPEMKATQINKELKRLWSELEEEEQQEYIDMENEQ